MTSRPIKHTTTQRWKKYLWWFARWLLAGALVFWLAAALLLVAARWIDPPTTAVQIERRAQAWVHDKPYRKRYQFVPLNQMSPNLQHAVIAAEDGRFYHHHGFDWHEIEIAAQEDLEGERTRGASTLTQQLVKNLFFGTSRSIVRKGAEATLVPVAEAVLGKQRILELYLNLVEWGPAFMVQSGRVVSTTERRRATSGGKKQRDSRRSYPVRSNDDPSA